MKVFAISAIAAFASVASAQFGALPKCAVPCANKLLDSTGCKPLDYKCICSNEKFIKDIAPCVMADCPLTEMPNVLQYSTDLCGGSGAPIDEEIYASASAVVHNGTKPSETSSPSSKAEAEEKDKSAGAMVRPAIAVVVAAALGALAI